MSRRRAAEKREILPDPKFGDKVVAKLANSLMTRGKKSLAENILYGAFDIIQKKLDRNCLEVFKDALANVRPDVEVRSRLVGGATYQVPTPVPGVRSQALAIRWIIAMASRRGEKTMTEKVAGELMDASNNRGAAVKKREDTHKMADANRAFAHYRW